MISSFETVAQILLKYQKSAEAICVKLMKAPIFTICVPFEIFVLTCGVQMIWNETSPNDLIFDLSNLNKGTQGSKLVGHTRCTLLK